VTALSAVLALLGWFLIYRIFPSEGWPAAAAGREGTLGTLLLGTSALVAVRAWGPGPGLALVLSLTMAAACILALLLPLRGPPSRSGEEEV